MRIKLLLRQFRWQNQIGIDGTILTEDLHHDDHVAQRLVPVQYDVHDVNAWNVTWFPSVL